MRLRHLYKPTIFATNNNGHKYRRSALLKRLLISGNYHVSEHGDVYLESVLSHRQLERVAGMYIYVNRKRHF